MLNKNSDALADISYLGQQLCVTEDSKGSLSFSIAGLSPTPDLIIKIMSGNKKVFTEKLQRKPTTLGVKANHILLWNVETEFRSH